MVMVGVLVMVGVVVLVGVFVTLGVLVLVEVLVSVGVEEGTGVAMLIDPPTGQRSKVRTTLIVPYKAPVTLLNLPVKALAAPAASAIGRGAAAHTSGEVNALPLKIVTPLNFSLFRVWLGQPFAQVMLVWTR